MQTHNVALASPIAEYVVSMRDGKIHSQGSLSKALEKDARLSAEAQEDVARISKAEEHDELSSESKTRANRGKLVVDEEISEGHVGWAARKCSLLVPTKNSQ